MSFTKFEAFNEGAEGDEGGEAVRAEKYVTEIQIPNAAQSFAHHHLHVRLMNDGRFSFDS